MMNSVNKTLYIPLYGKALVSGKGLLLHDPKAEAIWASEGFPLKAKSRSKWLAYYMAMRAAVFDDWLRGQLDRYPDAVVLHIGCGLDSRNLRVAPGNHVWYDIDFPEVIAQRRRFYRETDTYRMIGGDATEAATLSQIPHRQTAIVVMEGISMYLRRESLTSLLAALTARFSQVRLLMDCYTELAARASRYKNPVKDVGVMEVFGVEDPKVLTAGTGLLFLGERDMTPDAMVNQLPGMERAVFRALYSGVIARSMYRIYEYGTAGEA